MNVPERLGRHLPDRYALEREIGADGMATVYLARDLRHNRRVALKVLNAELGAVLGTGRFLSEIETTANLQHAHMLPLFDSGEAGGLLFYVMPYVEGESLRVRLERERQLPIEDAVRIAVAVAGALDYAHRRGVVHRDLKPGNILLLDGQPLVADFGTALAVSKAGGAADSRRLYIRNRESVLATEIADSPSLRVAGTRSLTALEMRSFRTRPRFTGGSQYDVDPLGRGFVALVTADETATDILVSVNWAANLMRQWRER